MTNDERLAKGLGALSGVLGAAFLVAPAWVTRLIGLRADDRRSLVVRSVGLREAGAAAAILSRRRPALAVWARVAGDVKDLALLGLGARDRSGDRARLAAATAVVGGITLADVIVARRLTRVPSRDRQGRPARDEGIRVERAVTVAVEPSSAYAVWRDLEQLPRFMGHLESVVVTGERTSRWTAKAPGGTSISWDAAITEDVPGERLSWESVPGSTVSHEGTVRFASAPRGLGTEVHAAIRYEPPMGALGATVARMTGEEPRQQVADDLRRFQQLMETGSPIRSDADLWGRRLPQRPGQPPSALELAEPDGRAA